jgi:hypothetical protein
MAMDPQTLSPETTNNFDGSSVTTTSNLKEAQIMTPERFFSLILILSAILVVVCAVALMRLVRGHHLWEHVIDRGYEIGKYASGLSVSVWFATIVVLHLARGEAVGEYLTLSIVFTVVISSVIIGIAWAIGYRSAKVQLRESRASADE